MFVQQRQARELYSIEIDSMTTQMAKKRAQKLIKVLAHHGLAGHHAGVDTSVHGEEGYSLAEQV